MAQPDQWHIQYDSHPKPQTQQLDDALYLWITDMTVQHAAINDEMLLTKARQLGDQLNVTDFAYSREYLQRFKSRRGIKRKFYQGEAYSADMDSVDTGRQQLRHELRNYDQDDIFNLDETGLLYRLGPQLHISDNEDQRHQEIQRQNYSSPDSECYWYDQTQTLRHNQSESTQMFWQDLRLRDLRKLQI